MHRKIEEVEFVVFDTETTGLDPAGGDRIVEIAALRLKGDADLGSFQSLVNPQRPVSPAAFAVNGISPEMLAPAPLMAEVLPGFLRFIEGACLCSYNMPFDMGFLNQELRLAGCPPLGDQPAIDILPMARRLLPGLPRYALWCVAQALQCEDRQEHRAFADVALTVRVFRHLVRMLRERQITSFGTLARLFSLDFGQLDDLESQVVARLQEAIDLGAQVRIQYLSTQDGAITRREIRPQRIVRQGKSAYVSGFCSLRQGERTFKISHILEVETP